MNCGEPQVLLQQTMYPENIKCIVAVFFLQLFLINNAIQKNEINQKEINDQTARILYVDNNFELSPQNIFLPNGTQKKIKKRKMKKKSIKPVKYKFLIFFVKYLPVDQTLVSSNENERLSTNTVQTWIYNTRKTC